MKIIFYLCLIILLTAGCADKKAGFNEQDAKGLLILLKEKKSQNQVLSNSIGHEIEVLEKNILAASTEGLKEKFKNEIRFKTIAKEKLDFAIANEDSAIFKINLGLDTLRK